MPSTAIVRLPRARSSVEDEELHVLNRRAGAELDLDGALGSGKGVLSSLMEGRSRRHLDVTPWTPPSARSSVEDEELLVLDRRAGAELVLDTSLASSFSTSSNSSQKVPNQDLINRAALNQQPGPGEHDPRNDVFNGRKARGEAQTRQVEDDVVRTRHAARV